MDKDIIDAEEMYERVKAVRKNHFQLQWKLIKEHINYNIDYAVRNGLYETKERIAICGSARTERSE